MTKEEQWVATAKKYKPDLTEEQEKVVRQLAHCKKYGPEWNKELRNFEQIQCGCELCQRIQYHSLKEAARELGIIGGKSKTAAKVNASKKNGKKGGRPKNLTENPPPPTKSI